MMALVDTNIIDKENRNSVRCIKAAMRNKIEARFDALEKMVA